MMFTSLRNSAFKLKMLGLLAFITVVTMIPMPSYALVNSSNLPAIGGQNSSKVATRGYHYLSKAQGQGLVLSSMVGPGVSASSQSFYLTYAYIGGTMDFVAVDPNSGVYQVYSSPTVSEQGAWAMTVGPDNNMYIGTLPNAHLLKFNTSLQQLSDIGQVPPDTGSATSQSYIWQLTVSPHTHKIYGCTYPSADLISYSPLDTNPTIVNLGTMDPTHQEQYARTCVADPNPNSPYIYVGLGSVSTQFVAYNTDTQTITPLMTIATASFGWVYVATDGYAYSYVRSCSICQYYLMSNGRITQANAYVGPVLTNVLNDGGFAAVTATTITIAYSDKPTTVYPYYYAGRAFAIMRLALGADGIIYGGTVLPYDFFAYTPGNPGAVVQMMGQIGNGEPYSLVAYNKLLYIAGYSIPALAVYDPSNPFNAATNPSGNPAGNLPGDLRPEAMISAPNNHLYIGSVGSYGILTGPLIVWNTLNNNDVQEFFPIQNQGIYSLAATSKGCQDSSGSYCIIAGTTILGGSGTTPATTSAQIFSWNPTTNKIVHNYQIPNVSNPSMITDLITNSANGYVYGIATNSNESYIFVFNPGTGKFINGGQTLPFYGASYNSIAIYKGNLWGIMPQGVFKISLNNVSQATLIPSSSPITAGFAIQGNTLYFASNSDIVSYTIV